MTRSVWEILAPDGERTTHGVSDSRWSPCVPDTRRRAVDGTQSADLMQVSGWPLRGTTSIPGTAGACSVRSLMKALKLLVSLAAAAVTAQSRSRLPRRPVDAPDGWLQGDEGGPDTDGDSDPAATARPAVARFVGDSPADLPSLGRSLFD